MALFDFLDSRKSVAKWAAKLFRKARQTNPNLATQDIIEIAVRTRYGAFKPNPHQAAILHEGRRCATDIFTFCHLIAEVELLSHLNAYDRMTMQLGGENIVQHTYDVMDQELLRLGFQR